MTCAPVEVGARHCSLADAPAPDAPGPPRRQAENDLNEALSSLSSAAKQEALQLALMQRAQHDAPQPDAVRSLEAMGFGADAARRALVVTHGDVAAAATKLAAEGGGGGGAAAGGGTVPFTADAIAAAVAAAGSGAGASSSSAAAPAPAPGSNHIDDAAERARIEESIHESGLQHAVRCARCSE